MTGSIEENFSSKITNNYIDRIKNVASIARATEKNKMPKSISAVLKKFDEQIPEILHEFNREMNHVKPLLPLERRALKTKYTKQIKTFLSTSIREALEAVKLKEEPLPPILWKDDHEENLIKQVRNKVVQESNTNISRYLGEEGE